MGIILSMMSQLLYISEKMIACFACTMLITCLIATFIVILALGIGLGYNYCFVDIKTKHRYVPRQYYRPPGQHQGGYHPGGFYYVPGRSSRNNSGGDPYVDQGNNSSRGEDKQPDIPIQTLPTDTSETTVEESNENSTNVPTNSTNVTTNSINDPNSRSFVFITRESNNSSFMDNTSTEASSISSDTVSSTAVIKKVERGPLPMIIPINGLDLIALLSKLRSENRNYSLQIVTS